MAALAMHRVPALLAVPFVGPDGVEVLARCPVELGIPIRGEYVEGGEPGTATVVVTPGEPVVLLVNGIEVGELNSENAPRLGGTVRLEYGVEELATWSSLSRS